jgi:hypothetical protein
LCCDFKVVTFLNGLQSGYTKYNCFICLWDSRYKGNQYEKKEWQLRSETTRRTNVHNVRHEALVPSQKILLPPLHIKLGIVKSFIKTVLKKNDEAMGYLHELFPKPSAAKLKEGTFIEITEIRYFINGVIFAIS